MKQNLLGKCPKGKVRTPPLVSRRSILKVPQKWLKSMKYVKYNSYLCQTMWNHAKKLMKTLKRQNSLFFHCEISSVVLKTRKIRKTRQTKTRITQNFHILYPGVLQFTFWASPQQILLHFPNSFLHFPIKIASFTQKNAAFPQQNAAFLNRLLHLPNCLLHFPMQCCVTLPIY